MRVAKASTADIDAALELLGFLDCIAKGYYPTLQGEEVDDDMQMYVDEDDPDHLRHVWRSLRKILDKAPGFQGRVLFGFATIADPRNKILNPDADCIELHPRFAEIKDTMAKVFAAIRSERDYQDRKWGTIAEHPHEVGGWLTLLSVHLRRAQEAWAGANSDHEALDELRKVLAIGVACAEQHGITGRARAQAVSQRMRGDGYQRTPSSE